MTAFADPPSAQKNGLGSTWVGIWTCYHPSVLHYPSLSYHHFPAPLASRGSQKGTCPRSKCSRTKCRCRLVNRGGGRISHILGGYPASLVAMRLSQQPTWETSSSPTEKSLFFSKLGWLDPVRSIRSFLLLFKYVPSKPDVRPPRRTSLFLRSVIQTIWTICWMGK